MPPSPYQPLAQEGDDFFQGSSGAAEGTAYPPKPETYYGEGPFDPPSSDDEADELLEKGGQRSGRAIEEEGTLVIGSRKVRPTA